MRVTYFYRSLKCGFSIKKVFNTVSDEISKTCTVKSHYLPAHHSNLISVIENIVFVFKHRDKEGVNHVTGDVQYCILGLIGCKSVLTIHDLSHIDFAKNPIKKAIIVWLWYKLPVLLASKVVCISKHTRDELARISNRKDIDVIYNSIDPLFNTSLKPFNTGKPNILQIGTASNKNLSNTIKAIASIECHFVIIGSLEDDIAKLLKEYNISHSIKTNLSDLELIEEYKQCDIVSFCSFYEGFGMPIIEGNAIGRCVITSNVTPMPEIALDAAVFVNPHDPSSIKKGFDKIISDKVLRATLISNGFSNLKRFNVANISNSYIQVYNSL
jgi:glycosyltransferase involved in cell wall biosynthesis